MALASVDGPCLQDQLRTVMGLSPLPARTLEPEELEALLQQARGGKLTTQEPAWLLRVGVNPEATPLLLARAADAGLQLELGAGSGLGMAWTAEAIEPATVETLRAFCQELGGHLTVLAQPDGAGVQAWCDAPARELIEAVKRQFDPRGQLAPGRLPGVASPQPVAVR